MNQLINNKLQVSFLPWANLSKNMTIGPIIFWPYFNAKNQNKITDSETKEYLNKLFNLFVDYQSKPVKTITICSYNGNNLFKLNDSIYEILRFTIDILIFTSIAPMLKTIVSNINHSGGWAPPTTNIFELHSFPLPDSCKDDFIAFLAGKNFHLFKIGDSKFYKPFETGGIFLGPDEKLTIEFSRLFSEDFPKNIYKRILRSLEWFRLAHVEGNEISELSKIVMMSTAFEILLKFPEYSKEKKSYFVNYIKEHIVTKDFVKETRKISNKSCETTCERTLAEFWASDFYDLRSNIVHGDKLSLKDLIYKKSLSHIIVADLVFLECMMQVLFGSEFNINNNVSLNEKFLELLTNKKHTNQIKKSLILKWIWDVDDIHKALGWILNSKGGIL